MREKELRLALVCYGGVSLAVYMHGITKEVWRLARASQAFHGGAEPEGGSQGAYHRLLIGIADEAEVQLRVLPDIFSGASAGGINAIFLAHAISSGQSLEPLTQLWLDHADVNALLTRDRNALRRLLKSIAIPFAWSFSRRASMVTQTVEPEHRDEVRAKLANFVRAPWFAPPFSGPVFSGLLLNAFDAMAAAPAGPRLLPDYQPLDLFVTVTDFRGHPQRLRLNSPPEVVEREHRVTVSFRDPGGRQCRVEDPIALVFAARATASFPGAFTPFQPGELDAVLAHRGRSWPGRDSFLARTLSGSDVPPEQVVLIDGGVQANAPFRPCIEALRSRPARREIDRRFVYIDPSPGIKSVRLTRAGYTRPPGFFATIFGALSDIPREQPIRDNLETIQRRSDKIMRLRRIVDSMRPEVEAAIQRHFGTAFLLGRATPRRLQIWRGRANQAAGRDAGYAFAPYAQAKLSAVLEDMARSIALLGGIQAEAVREPLWRWAVGIGLTSADIVQRGRAEQDLVTFFRTFDVGFRLRRLRLLARDLAIGEGALGDLDRAAADAARQKLYAMAGRYEAPMAGAETVDVFAHAPDDPGASVEALAERLDLRALDEETDREICGAMELLPRPTRRSFLLTYLGYPFFDIATLPLLQGEGLQEFDPVKVDRISPDDATAIRAGGTLATLKGIQFNNFGAFFSRAYRENDYLWGRLHGADRLVDIIASTVPGGLPDALVSASKREAFRAILAEERPRLKAIPELFQALEREIG